MFVMEMYKDVFTGQNLCYHPTCHWETGDGWSGIIAKYINKEGQPCCWSHLSENEQAEEKEKALVN